MGVELVYSQRETRAYPGTSGDEQSICESRYESCIGQEGKTVGDGFIARYPHLLIPDIACNVTLAIA